MNLTKAQANKIKRKLKPLDLVKCYREMINEAHFTVEILDYTWEPAAVLEKMNPTAFTKGLVEYMDNLIGENQVIEIGGQYYDYEDVRKLIKGEK